MLIYVDLCFMLIYIDTPHPLNLPPCVLIQTIDGNCICLAIRWQSWQIFLNTKQFANISPSKVVVVGGVGCGWVGGGAVCVVCVCVCVCVCGWVGGWACLRRISFQFRCNVLANYQDLMDAAGEGAVHFRRICFKFVAFCVVCAGASQAPAVFRFNSIASFLVRLAHSRAAL